MNVSTNYRELVGKEIEEIAAFMESAWQDPRIPERQYELALRGELEQFRQTGEMVAPFAALHRCLKAVGPFADWPRFLDVGAASGFVSELLDHWNLRAIYTAIDFSDAVRDFARSLYPEITFDVGDARAMPYHDDYFDIVLSSACIMHCRQYAGAIAEAIRVSKRFVIFHRTPIIEEPTKFYTKEAYGVPCLEVHFNEKELLELFEKAGTTLLYSTDVFSQGSFGHRSYLLEKKSALNHIQV